MRGKQRKGRRRKMGRRYINKRYKKSILRSSEYNRWSVLVILIGSKYLQTYHIIFILNIIISYLSQICIQIRWRDIYLYITQLSILCFSLYPTIFSSSNILSAHSANSSTKLSLSFLSPYNYSFSFQFSSVWFLSSLVKCKFSLSYSEGK